MKIKVFDIFVKNINLIIICNMLLIRKVIWKFRGFRGLNLVIFFGVFWVES